VAQADNLQHAFDYCSSAQRHGSGFFAAFGFGFGLAAIQSLD
jgi:hypothetical protein